MSSYWQRVVGTVDGETVVYIAGVYEYHEGGATISYYDGSAGSVAMRRVGHADENGIFYIVGDHLGSASVIVNQDGTPSSYQYYTPFGGNRGGLLSPLTTKRYTGQYHEDGLPGGEGLSYYSARWYDAQVGKFTSADLLVPTPEDPLDLNRFAYVRNNPIRYTDPTGHLPCQSCGLVEVADTPTEIINVFLVAAALGSAATKTVKALVTTTTVALAAGAVANVASTMLSPADQQMIRGGVSAGIRPVEQPSMQVTPPVNVRLAFFGPYNTPPGFNSPVDLNPYIIRGPIPLAPGMLIYRAKRNKTQEQGVPPPNLTPDGAGRRGAFRQAKRDAGIPVSEQPKFKSPPDEHHPGKKNPAVYISRR